MADMTGMDEGWLEESHYKMSKKIAQLTRVPPLTLGSKLPCLLHGSDFVMFLPCSVLSLSVLCQFCALYPL
jgi:hypothetical protein